MLNLDIMITSTKNIDYNFSAAYLGIDDVAKNLRNYGSRNNWNTKFDKYLSKKLY